MATVNEAQHEPMIAEIRGPRPRRRSNRIDAHGGAPNFNPKKKLKPSLQDLVSEEDEETEQPSPAKTVGQEVEERSDSGSEFDDTGSDQYFRENEDGGDESSSEEEEETLSDYLKNLGKIPRKNGVSPKPTRRPTSSKRSGPGSSSASPVDVGEESDESNSELEPSPDHDMQYYSTAVKRRWPSYSVRSCIREKKIDVSSFKRYNMIEFLIRCGMMPTLQYASPFVEKVVKLFYANISLKFGVTGSRQYGKVYIRRRVYDFRPQKINEFLGVVDFDDDDAKLDDKDEITSHITGGKMIFHRKNFPASNLTALHGVLHKLAIYNWLPTTHSTTVTQDQQELLYKLSCGVRINLGKFFFKKMCSEAETFKTSALPYPSLIYQMLRHQGFMPGPEDDTTPEAHLFTITSQNVCPTDERVVDLPWSDHQNPAPDTVEQDVAENVEPILVTRSFLLQELMSCNDLLKSLSIQLQQATARKAKLERLLSSQRMVESSGTAGREEDNEENAAANADDYEERGQWEEAFGPGIWAELNQVDNEGEE